MISRLEEPSRVRRTLTSLVLALLCLGLGVVVGLDFRKPGAAPAPTSQAATPKTIPPVLTTNLYRIRTREIALPFTDEDGRPAGGFDVVSDSEVYAITVSGNLYRVSTSAPSFVDGSGTISFVLIDSLRRSLAKLPLGFGAKSVTVLDARTLLVSFTEYHADLECADVSVMRIALAGSRIVSRNDTVFRTRCTPRGVVSNTQSEGVSSGGEIQILDRTHVLLSVGDFFHESLAADPQSDWGKIWQVDLAGGRHRIFSRGHRNPQGLFVTRSPFRVFETEHGPQGGDEINLLVEGADYGWPFVTYGHPYIQQQPPFDGDQLDFANRNAAILRRKHPGDRLYGAHGRGAGHRFTEPLFAFTPSIAISRLVYYPCPSRMRGATAGSDAGGDTLRFLFWCDDLIVGSLVGESLFRVVLSGLDPGLVPTVRMVEPIPIGRRIRGLRLLPNGALIMKTDRSSLVVLWHRNN